MIHMNVFQLFFLLLSPKKIKRPLSSLPNIVVSSPPETCIVKFYHSENDNDTIDIRVIRYTTYNCFNRSCDMAYNEKLSCKVEEVLRKCAIDICVCSQWHLEYSEGQKMIPLDGELELGRVFHQLNDNDEEQYLYLVANKEHVGIDVKLYKDKKFCFTICLAPTLRLRDLKEQITWLLCELRNPIVKEARRILEQGIRNAEAARTVEKARRLVEQDIRNVRVKVCPENGYPRELCPNSRTMAELNILQGQQIHFYTEGDLNACRLHFVPNDRFQKSESVSVQRTDIEAFTNKLKQFHIDPVNNLQFTIRKGTYSLSGAKNTKILDRSQLEALMNDEEILVERVDQAVEIKVWINYLERNQGSSSDTHGAPRYTEKCPLIYPAMCVSDLKKRLLLTEAVSPSHGIWHMRLYRGNEVYPGARELNDDDLLLVLPYGLEFRLEFYAYTVMVVKKPFEENDKVRPFGVDHDRAIPHLIKRFCQLDSTLSASNEYKLEYKGKDVTSFSQVADLDLVMLVLKDPAPNTPGPSEENVPFRAIMEDQRHPQLQSSRQVTDVDGIVVSTVLRFDNPQSSSSASSL